MKQVGIKTIGWFDENELPVVRMISALEDQDAVIKAFLSQNLRMRLATDNSVELYTVQEEQPTSEKVSIQTATREQLLVIAAKNGITGVDGRSSKPNIIAAIRKHANAQSEEKPD